MGLSAYKKKRSFDKTPEPSGGEHISSKQLRFVIQKHHASRLHYDFRLEMEGVLKSWAVPKGPSLNPEEKRLAMMVEDHPYNYRRFEGIIPEGNYGAGTVIIWDEGTYEPAEPLSKNKKEQEKNLLSQLYKGNLKIKLNGKKLKGEFALIHTKRPGQENAWLLIKKEDQYSGKEDITKKDKSVVSGKSLEKVSATSTNEWKSNRSSSGKKKKIEKITELEETSAEITDYKKSGEKELFPDDIKPMLATLIDEPFDDKEWIYEIKWDGYRTLAFVKNGKAEIKSRNNLSYNAKFHPVADALKKWKINAVVDGEIIAMNEKGNADFQLLQAWQKTGKGNLAFYAFDIIWLNGYSLTRLPLLERKEILQQLVPQDSLIRYSDHIIERGKEFYELAVKQGLEGIMAKKADSPYHLNSRTQYWLKIKTTQRQEAVIAGFTKGRGGRKHFGSLVLGLYKEGELQYIGHTGSGFDEKMLGDVFSKLETRIIKECPFKVKPKTKMPVIWVKPELVCEVKFQEWTRDNAMRHPIFMGLRDDKKAKDVKREEVVEVEEALEEGKVQQSAKKKATIKKSAKTKAAQSPAQAATHNKQVSNQSIFDPKEKKQELTFNNNNITFTNLDKIYWKKEKITKGDMLNYYNNVMEYILPYLKDRPQSLNRNPDGADGKSFYQKNVAGKVPSWVKTYDYETESDGEKKKFFVCTNEASLLYMANLGCIEMNPWHSRITSADNPDWCVIDLDPAKISFEKVIEAANVVKEVLDSLELPSFCKTSGSTGLHIYIPLEALYSYEQSKQLAELIVTLVHDQIPKFTSLERSPAKRKTKIYLDYLQNRSIQTIAAPYSLRPKPGATVSTPLHWEEVKKGLKISDFTIFNILDRLKNERDLFTGVLGKGIDLEKTLEKAEKLVV